MVITGGVFTAETSGVKTVHKTKRNNFSSDNFQDFSYTADNIGARNLLQLLLLVGVLSQSEISS